MDDRTLLELAAKAVGIDLQTKAMFGGDAEPGYYEYPPEYPPIWVWWNPLMDDGDALRLAVKLDLLTGPAFWHERSVQYAMSAFNGDRQDPYAATRRAIVLAAAEIGKSRVSAPGAVEGEAGTLPPLGGGE